MKTMIVGALLLSPLFACAEQVETYVRNIEHSYEAFQGGSDLPHHQGWNKTISVPKHAAGSGSLRRVRLTVEHHDQWEFGFENLYPPGQPATARFHRISDRLRLKIGEQSVLHNEIDPVDQVLQLGPPDGTFDFGGPGGYWSGDLFAQKKTSIEIQDPRALTLFTGSGDITLPVEADSNFLLDTDSGGYIYGLHFRAGARITVEYYY